MQRWRSGDGSRTQRQLRTTPRFLLEIIRIQSPEPTRPEPNVRKDSAQEVTEITAARTGKRRRSIANSARDAEANRELVALFGAPPGARQNPNASMNLYRR